MKVSSNSRLIQYLKAAKIEVTCCPHCNSNDFIKHGNYFGMQRYRCKNSKCTKTFTQKTLSAWSYSKKDFETWQEYIELIVCGNTLRQCAYKVEICICTSFYWRRKILNIINKIDKTELLCNKVEINKFMIKENFKGEKVFKTDDRKLINVISSLDNNNNVMSKAVSKGILSINILKEKVCNRIHKDAYIFANGDRILKVLTTNYNKNKVARYIEENVAYKFNKDVNKWLEKFKGVATKYIDSYLSWYISIYKNHNLLNIINFICKIKSFKRCNQFSKSKLFNGYYY